MVDMEKFLKEFNDTFEEKNKCEIINRHRIWLNVSDVCDLSCIYCSSFCDIKSAKKTNFMTLDTAIKSINNAIEEFKTNKLKICFFGGEPLLNRQLIYDVVDYCNNRDDVAFTFSVSTNALRLDEEFIDFISKNNFDSVQISIDGNEDIQNKQRPKIENRYYPKRYSIEDKIQMLLKKVDNNIVTARATFTPYSLHISDTFKYLADLGFKKIHFEPNISREKLSINNDESINILNDEIKKLTKLFFEYKDAGKINRLIPLSNYYDILTYNNCLVHNCEAGIRRYAYSVDGKRSPCHMVKGAEPEKLKEAIQKRDNECNNCAYNNICQGLCLGAIYYAENDYTLSCKLHKMYIQEMVNELNNRDLLLK